MDWPGRGERRKRRRRGGARGQAGMEPAEGPGALGFHGDEEIIEVVELGPPGPGETGRPCRVRGPAGSPASHRGTGPAPAPPQCWARPRVPARSPPRRPGPAAFPRVALRSFAAPLLWVSWPRRHRDGAFPGLPRPPGTRRFPPCPQAASRVLTFVLRR